MKKALTIYVPLALTMMFLIGCPKRQTVKTGEPPSQTPQITEPAKPPAEEAATAVPVEFRTVYFDLDSYDIRPDAKPLLAEASKIMRQYPKIALRLEGHCDERGTAEYNLALGEKRANAVRDYLVGLGVERSRLATVSFGKERPADAGHDETAWARNRRVEFPTEGK